MKSLPFRSSQAAPLRSFTLVELLVVMGIIAILAGLTLGVGNYVTKEASRTKAKNEIAALELALESFKIDNGAYPQSQSIGIQNGAYDLDPTQAEYINNASILLTNVWGKSTTNYVANIKTYYPNVKLSQVGGLSPNIYLKDPFGNAYGYTSGSNAYFNTNFFDLWSVTDQTGQLNKTNVTQWVSNWKPN